MGRAGEPWNSLSVFWFTYSDQMSMFFLMGCNLMPSFFSDLLVLSGLNYRLGKTTWDIFCSWIFKGVSTRKCLVLRHSITVGVVHWSSVRHPGPTDATVCGTHQRDIYLLLDISICIWVRLLTLFCNTDGYPSQGSLLLHTKSTIDWDIIGRFFCVAGDKPPYNSPFLPLMHQEDTITIKECDQFFFFVLDKLSNPF